MVDALEGTTILEWGEFISAPYCSKLLADMGATVVKVENPKGGDRARRHGPFPNDIPDPEKSGLFLYLNTNKLGITLNLEDSKGREIFRALLNRVDVLIENQPLAVKGKLGLNYKSLEKEHPKLIVTSITPFGDEGPESGRKAHDINVCALGGVSYCIGDPGQPPLTTPYYQSEFQGALGGAAGTLLAILAKSENGVGQHVDISSLDIWSTLHPGSKLIEFTYWGGISGKRQGYRRAGEPYPFTHLPCKDGYMCLFTREGRQWKKFIEIVGDPELLNNPRFRDRRAMGHLYPEEVDARLIPWLKDRTRQEIFDICLEAGISFAPLRSIEEVVNCKHLAARRYFAEVEFPAAGNLEIPGAPYQLSETPCRIKRPAPLLGAHNEDVLCGWLGYSREDLLKLRQCGAI